MILKYIRESHVLALQIDSAISARMDSGNDMITMPCCEEWRLEASGGQLRGSLKPLSVM